MDHRLTVVKPQLYFPWLQMPNENINIINTEHLTNNEKHWERLSQIERYQSIITLNRSQIYLNPKYPKKQLNTQSYTSINSEQL